jgi:hypothetical protein
MDKCSSLLRESVIYCRKKIYSTGPSKRLDMFYSVGHFSTYITLIYNCKVQAEKSISRQFMQVERKYIVLYTKQPSLFCFN